MCLRRLVEVLLGLVALPPHPAPRAEQAAALAARNTYWMKERLKEKT